MKVRLCKTVQLDEEIDIGIDDVLNSFEAAFCDENEPGSFRNQLGVVQYLTKMLARVPNSVIVKSSENVRSVVAERLRHELERWSNCRHN